MVKNSIFDVNPDLLRQSQGEKWNTYPGDVLPLWVAEMDFHVAEAIQRTLSQAISISDLGYPVEVNQTRIPELFAQRMLDRFHWNIDPSLVELTSEVVQAIYIALWQLADEGDGIIVQTPIYPPFLAAVEETRRRLVENPLVEEEGEYAVDLSGLKNACDERTRILLLCNPHNPTGRVFRKAELEGIASIVLEHNLIVVSDEIHADLVFSGHQHIPFASLGAEISDRTITLYSASKAFNIAGLRCAVAVFGSQSLRQQFLGLPRHMRGGLSHLGILATQAAWNDGNSWLDSVLTILEENRDWALNFIRTELGEIRPFTPEGTYLAWLDCRELELSPSPYSFFLNRAKVAYSDGRTFGGNGSGFVRLNFATSPELLREALERTALSLAVRI